MKKLLIVSIGQITGNAIAKQLIDLIGDFIIIEPIQSTEIESHPIDCDLILFTSDLVQLSSIQKIKKDMDYIIAKRVINHKNIEQLISLAYGTEVLLVNDAKNSTFEAIRQLEEIGLDDIKYYPVYPGCENHPKLTTAITPGESHLVPHSVEEIIDIKTRILDISTIYEIILRLKLSKFVNESLTTRYIKDIVEISKSIDINRKAIKQSEKLLETILNNVESGVVYINALGKIIRINKQFENMLNKHKKDLFMQSIHTFFPNLDLSISDTTSIITTIGRQEVLVKVDPIIFEDHLGYVITVEYTEKISKLDHSIRRNYVSKFINKHYTFHDYITVNHQVEKLLERAEKFSKTDATILIQGENGTGKEIIAQSIHMNSYRKKNVFIPVNIAAITPNLLESELFGYEEGAFTGARKGGKAGLFEIANDGTLFIDEIGDAPLDFQVKLLRVLQEKRIRRICAAEEIPINVRVITATNKNLISLIDKEAFREDLFFRLNILPLKTIPLRSRQEDIPHLLKHFIEIYFSKEKIKPLDDLFEQDTLAFLKSYRWRGNVRELINLVEYLTFVYEEKKITLSDLPYYLLESVHQDEKIYLNRHELWVLDNIYKNEGIGRSKLKTLADKQLFSLGEGKIRSILASFNQKELIEIGTKKRGCCITKKGIHLLEKLK
ncbi:sigma-54 interaction domain-containing protein [Marinisporobacter balticus]|uniref:Transcriptional regulator with PAS, ATPase and Fis domain n=1 Tax=Marinisporobacter balticus TaxID=2018667 RepID=A0A4R2KY77_9FIRM|nr:sigma 54-interacting transcriptional regulator [Marinisporobacter balticus]TCO75228.1 transcriptional regulator with PAS, ATPase and Fis domain [Marinisporobacter balticus]